MKPGRALFKLKLGQPRNKGLSRMMEDPELRKLIDKAELEFYKDTDGKAALVDLKEELFFTIEERQHDADLTQKGRDFLNPDDPDAFVLPDLLTEFADIENKPDLSDAEKGPPESRPPAILRHSGGTDPQHFAASESILPL